MSLFDGITRWLKGDPYVEPLDIVYDAEGDAGRVIERLREVIDPEVGLDIVSMGLIRGIVVEDGRAMLRMTLTTAGCPLAGIIGEQVEDAIRCCGLDPDVELEFVPPWTPEHIREADG